MKCLERERIFAYVHRLLEAGEVEEVRAHLDECPACRAVAQDEERLDSVLAEWKAPEASPWFDARLRARLASENEGGFWGFWGFLAWRRWLLPATIVALIVLGIVVTREAPRQPQQMATQEAPRVAPPIEPLPEVPQPEKTVQAQASVPGAKQTPAKLEEDELSLYQNLPLLEDYELLANFDVLSELPVGDQKVVN